jgi:hypothetical protein
MAHAILIGTRPALHPARRAAPPLRLTRRGRIVLVIVPLFLATLGLLVGWAAMTAPAQAGDGGLVGPGATVTVTVQPGESLWTIASSRVPDQDPRVTISQIQDLNGLGRARVVPGEQILVPAGR